MDDHVIKLFVTSPCVVLLSDVWCGVISGPCVTFYVIPDRVTSLVV